MEELLTNLLDSASAPMWSAFLLGLLTAISPCPMTTNITAIGYISKNVGDKKVVFVNGLLYTLGRISSYTLLAVVLFLGADQVNMAGIFQRYGEKFIGPLLIVVGLFMLGVFKLNFSIADRLVGQSVQRVNSGWLSAFFLGFLFALAFCPYSGVLYFGMLIPMTISSASGLILPPVFALATGIPVIFFAWLIAFSVGSLGGFYNRLKIVELWFRRIVAVLFLAIGTYYIWLMIK